jgi:DNA-binding MarR family transcriptional regulator
MPPRLPFDPVDEAGRQWLAHYPDGPVAAMRAVTSLMRVQQIVLGALNDALEPFGLTFARYEVLMLLSFTRAGALPLGKIGERLQVHPTSVTNLIDGLQRAGFVQRDPHPRDRRATLATLTERGRVTAAAATEALHAISFGAGALEPGQLDQLSDILLAIRLDAGDFEA